MIKFDSIKKRNIRIEDGTLGGSTYFVILPGEKEERPLCFRRISSDKTMRCTNPAGYKTSHNGTGACLYHGGASTDSAALSNIKTGRFSLATKNRLSDSVGKYLQQDKTKLLDLSEQLAYAKAVFDEFVAEYKSPHEEEYGLWLMRFQNLLSTLGTLVEKISRMDTRNTITAAEVLYIRAAITDIIMKYVTDPVDRMNVAKELSSRLGGDMGEDVNIMPAEVKEVIDV